MALEGVRVLEFDGLAPVPFCGMILGDFGAEIIRVDRTGGETALSGKSLLSRGKKSIALDLKRADHIKLIKDIILQFDVVLDPYRPGVLERLGIGPEDLLAINPKLIFARLTGFNGSNRLQAGHDLNYLAATGLLSNFKRNGEKPMFPANILGDFAGGSLTCAFGIAAALVERSKSGKGQVVEASIVSGTAYLGTFLYNIAKTPMWSNSPGNNLLDSGSPNYDVYATKDGQYMAVACLEPQFYQLMLTGLELDGAALPCVFDASAWPKLREIFDEKFKSKTRKEWEAIFQGTDACVTPVLTLEEAEAISPTAATHGPQPAPLLSRTPAIATTTPSPTNGQHTVDVLRSLGVNDSVIRSVTSSKPKL